MTTEQPNKFQFIAESESRLDIALAKQYPEFSRNFWMERCKAGVVLVAGKKRPPAHLVKPGDSISLVEEPTLTQARTLAHLPELDIRYQDNDLLVLNKPAGIPSVTLSKDDPETLADRIVTLFPECLQAGEDLREAGLIHRLDTAASGLIIAARNRESWYKLRESLKAREVEKEYLVLVEWAPPEYERLELFLSAKGKKVRISPDEFTDAERTETKIKTESALSESTSLVRVSAPFAKRHQVRAVLSYLGNPLIGDTLYGSERSLSEFGVKEEFFLHCEKVVFPHPRSGERIEVVADDHAFKR